jgi:hypothetical protein
MLDAEAHGKTWGNRNSDERLSSAANVRHAWENMLRDTGLQYSFLSYADVIRHGVPGEYRVLILPACLCLSDSESRAIGAFCEGGGTVIADYLPGLWDEHGKGRAEGGALDAMFGVSHDIGIHAADLFGGKLWVEVDQDANYSCKTYEELLTNKNSCIKDSTGFCKAARGMPVDHVARFGRGKAVLMNLSPQWYNAYRAEGAGAATKRVVFTRHITEDGIAPWVRIAGAGEGEHGYEITYWSLSGGRTLLFVCMNPEVEGDSRGGGNSTALKTDTERIELRFAAEIHRARDERLGRDLGDGARFGFEWKQNEAVVMSFEGR